MLKYLEKRDVMTEQNNKQTGRKVNGSKDSKPVKQPPSKPSSLKTKEN